MTAPRMLAGRYRTEQLLGIGGMAAVWRAHDVRLDRPVAIKELTGDGMGHPRALERFEREARTIARLAHPNIVAVYDFGTEDDDPYLVMELVDGRTVAELLADGPLPVADVLAIAIQTCDGLAAAHAAGIIHRDIKPGNLIVTPAGVVKIFDFGIAQFLDSAAHPALTASSVAMGSATYMAPEQINNEPVDPRTDLYALGCSLYEMLAGTPPFPGENPLSVAHQHVTRPPQPLAERRADVPAELATLVGELLAKTPDERPGDAATVRARLAALAPAGSHPPHGAAMVGAVPGGGAVGTGGPPPDRPVGDDGRGRRPRRRVFVLAALLAVALVAVLAALLADPNTDPLVTAPAPGPSSSPTPASPSPSPSAPASPSAATSTSAAARSASARPRSASPTPTDPIVALRLTIQAQVAAGSLNADTAQDLNHMVDDLAKSIKAGNLGDERKKLKALRDKLAGLYRDGRLSADGYRAISRDVDRLAATIG